MSVLDDAVFPRAFVVFLFLRADIKIRIAQSQEDGGRNIDGRGRAHEDADEHGQGKIMDHPAAEQEEGKRSHEGGAAGEDGARKRLVDAAIDQRGIWGAARRFSRKRS